MAVFLHALAIRNFKGIGPEGVVMAPFRDFNFFIGANNVGKSTVLSFVSNKLHMLRLRHTDSGQKAQIDPLDIFAGGMSGAIDVSVGILSRNYIAAAISTIKPDYHHTNYQTLISSITDMISVEGIVWFDGHLPNGEVLRLRMPTAGEIRPAIKDMEWSMLWKATTNWSSGGSIERNWVPETIDKFTNAVHLNIPPVEFIPAIRQVGPSGMPFADFSGQGLIDRLAEIQSPDYDRLNDRDLFDKINDFLKNVTEKADARIEIPHSRNHVLVHMDRKVLPLSSLGTGIHEVIMLAAACTISQNKIVCIEEPEIHLHPILQRKFIRYLQDNTNNQYFIATHSAAFIDTPEAAIFHVSHDGYQTDIKETILRRDRYNICVDLGYRASDIVQSNAVIWVEGPSERIYLANWISIIDENLVEGVHYSIMFYGGRLLSHLTSESDASEDFINLKYLNQNMAIIMDSDKDSADDDINDTKQRIIEGVSKGAGVGWLTAGREIENYIDFDLLQQGLKVIHPDLYDAPYKKGSFEHAFYFRTLKPRKQKSGKDTNIYKDADKVKLARWICKQPIDLHVMDLREKIKEIVVMIQKANS